MSYEAAEKSSGPAANPYMPPGALESGSKTDLASSSAPTSDENPGPSRTAITPINPTLSSVIINDARMPASLLSHAEASMNRILVASDIHPRSDWRLTTNFLYLNAQKVQDPEDATRVGLNVLGKAKVSAQPVNVTNLLDVAANQKSFSITHEIPHPQWTEERAKRFKEGCIDEILEGVPTRISKLL